MTNFRKIIFIPMLIAVAISALFSCGVDRWNEYAGQTALDTWIYDVMQKNYLWYGEMPPYKNVNPFLAPPAFLAKVKTSKDSYSFADSVMGTPLPTYGFDYSLVRNPENDTAYNALITYIIPGSPAEKAGMKRGDWVVKVDAYYISQKYEKQLLQGIHPHKITLGKYRKIEPMTPPKPGKEKEDIYGVVPTGEVSLGAAMPVEDTPVHRWDILTLSTGKKVGYLMYNGFTAGTATEPEKYNDELRRISGKLAEAGIRQLILDLRHNRGGSMPCVQLLSTILAPSSYLGQSMASLKYNDKNENKNVTLTFDQQLLQATGKNLNLSTLILLTSGETAGAPEMLINSLNGKIQQVIAIGSPTKGQNVATEKFVNEEFRWAVNPVVCTVFNAAGETYTSGFSPTYPINNASTDYLHFLPFGNPQETLLSAGIEVLEGTYPPKKNTGRGYANELQAIEKSVNSSASRRFAGGLQIK